MTIFNFVCFHGCGQTDIIFRQLLKNFEPRMNKLHKNNSNELIKHTCTFEYIRGNHALKEGGFSWYRDESKKGVYKINKQEREKRLLNTFSSLKNKENVILIGFSEGAMYVLDLAMKYYNDKNNSIIGVVALSPPYSIDVLSNDICETPCIIVTSEKDKNVSMKESMKWIKHYTNNIIHRNDKGHKVHLPLNIRDDIIKIMDDLTERVKRNNFYLF